MKFVAISLLLLTIVVPAISQPLTVLLLPPPLPPVNSDAQDAMVAALPVVWQKLMGKWAVVTFHKESPSIQRAKLEGKLPPDALTNPYEHADKLCAIEGTKVALWLRVTKAEDKTPRAIEARLLFPVDARFETDISETPITDEERKVFRPISPRTPPTPEMVLAFRLGQWLSEQVKPALESEPTQATAPDLKVAKSLIAEGKWDEAVQTISRIIAVSPQDPNLYFLLGQAYEGQRKWEDALLEYRRVVQLQPDFLDAWKGIARVAAQRNRWDLVLTAVRQVRKGQESIEPIYLALGAKAATNLASTAWRQGRDKESEALQKEAIELDTLLIQTATEPAMVLEAAERFQTNRKWDLAADALAKLVSQLPLDLSLADRILRMAWVLRRSDLVYQFLLRIASTKEDWMPSRDVFRIAVGVLDAEAVKLFEQVRNNLASFDATKLTREDLMARLQKVNAEAEQLLKTAHALKAPEIFAKTHNRRLLSYELFLQATTLLMQWVEQPDDLTRRRSVVLYEFARTELEQVWKEEQRLR
jgi:tetratricopeptide (TPR) repeat protein